MTDRYVRSFETSSLPPFEGSTGEDAAAYLESELSPWICILSNLAQQQSVSGELVDTIAANLMDAADAIAATLRGDRVRVDQVADASVRARLVEGVRAVLAESGDCATLQREDADRLLEAVQRHTGADGGTGQAASS